MATEVERWLHERFCSELRLEPIDDDRIRVFTPFRFDDGDHLKIILKRTNGSWALTDEGHTLMHLSYAVSEEEMKQESRQTLMEGALSLFDVQNRGGELLLPLNEDNVGDAIYEFAEAMIKVADVAYLSRERVRVAFFQDVERFLGDVLPTGRVRTRWYDLEHDAEGLYPVDFRIEAQGDPPWFLYALATAYHISVATIALHQFREWGLSHRPVGVVRDDVRIGSRDRARFESAGERAPVFMFQEDREGLMGLLQEASGPS